DAMRHCWLSIALFCFAVALPSQIRADVAAKPQTDSTEVSSDPETTDAIKLPTKEELEQRLAGLAQSSLDETQRKKATESYQAAILSLAKIEEQVADRAKKQRYIDNREANIAKQKALLAAPVAETPLPAETAELSV